MHRETKRLLARESSVGIPSPPERGLYGRTSENENAAFEAQRGLRRGTLESSRISPERGSFAPPSGSTLDARDSWLGELRRFVPTED
jgi:hypothetical protein